MAPKPIQPLGKLDALAGAADRPPPPPGARRSTAADLLQEKYNVKAREGCCSCAGWRG